MTHNTNCSPQPTVSAGMITAERLRDVAERDVSLLMTIVEYLPWSCYVGDLSGITLCNQTGLDLLGFHDLPELPCRIATLAAQLQTRRLETGTPIAPEEEPFSRALQGETCTLEVAYTHRATGEERIIECVAVPIRWQGKVIAALAVHTDITVRKRTEAALHTVQAQMTRIFDTVLSLLVDFVFTYNRENRFTYANQALLDLFQRSSEEVLGKTHSELGYPDELAARLDGHIANVFKTGKLARNETAFTDPSGQTGYYEYILAPIFDKTGAVEAVIGSSRKLTTLME